MTWVFVDDVDDPHLDDGDRHHLARVLRLRDGEALVASDGRGRWRDATFRTGGEVEVAGDVVVEPAPTPPITIAFAITKGEKPELAVQKLTELGVDRIVPFAAARSVARWDGERAVKHVERLRRVAREAAMQSRRCHLPALEPMTSFGEVASRPAAALADRGGAAPSLEWTTLAVAPEGGWSAAERDAGLPAVGLGPTVLRSETAAVTGASLLCALRAGIVQAHGG